MKESTNTFLFQGDSVTDAGRDRQCPQSLGNGYVSIIAGEFLKMGQKHKILNNAISGNRIGDMYARWIEDTLNIDFDVLSILCGINDVGFQLRRSCGADSEKFRFIYDRMLYEVMEKREKTKLILLEPFIFKVNLEETDMRNRNDIYVQYDLWSGMIRERGAIVKELAAKYHAAFVPLMDRLTQESKKTGADILSADGIHPTLYGHRIIAEEWMKVWESRKNEKVGQGE